MTPIKSRQGAKAAADVSSGDVLITALTKKTDLELTDPITLVSTLMLGYTNSE